MNLGTRLKNTLEARGLTVTQFAKEAAVPAQTIYALINRDSNKADMDILVKLLKALDTDFFTFMEVAPASGNMAAGQTGPEGFDAAQSDAASAKEDPAQSGKPAENEERIIVREVPAQAPDGKQLLYVDSDIYDQVLALAKDEGIEDEAVIPQVLNAYLGLGFGYRQRPLRSIFRDYIPKAKRSGDIDSFLL